MKKSIDIGRDSLLGLFFYFFIPNLCAMLALSTYSTVDGIFVGKAIGPQALAAIGVCWPVFPVLIAFELLFGMGAASIASYYLGKGQEYRARLMFSSVCYFAGISSIIFGIILCVFVEDIAFALGANDEILPFVIDYLRIIFLGSFIIVLHPLLDIFVINDKRPILAMSAMIIGSLVNIVLNYLFLFVFEFGIAGSAGATIIGHFLGMCILLSHFILKRGKIYFIKSFNLSFIFASARNGIPLSFSELSVSYVMMLVNNKLENLGGTDALAIYSILMYSGIVIFTIILSCAEGLQPIASFNYGAKQIDRVKRIYKLIVVFASICGISLWIIFVLFDSVIAGLFLSRGENSLDLLEQTTNAMHIYFLGYIFLGLNLVSSIFLQAIQRPISSFIITLCTNLLFMVVFVNVLSVYFGINGIWASYPISLICASIVSLCVIYYEFKYGALCVKNKV